MRFVDVGQLLVCRFCMITHENLSKFHSESDHDFPAVPTADAHADNVAAVAMDNVYFVVPG